MRRPFFKLRLWPGLFFAGLMTGAVWLALSPRRVAPRSEGSARALPLFQNVREASGVNFPVQLRKVGLNLVEALGHGAGLCDFNGDGHLDLLLTGPNRVALFRGDGAFRFSDVTPTAGLRQRGDWRGVATGDFDGDGKLDLYLGGYDCSALYRNLGGFRFREVTEQAGVGVRPPTAGGAPECRTSAAFLDADRDGRLDLFVLRYVEFGANTPDLCHNGVLRTSCDPSFYRSQYGVFYRNLGDGRFRDETGAWGLRRATGHALGVACADFNDDGRTDLAIANDGRPGDLFINRLGRGFFQYGIASGTAYAPNGDVHAGMAAEAGDYNRDGRFDLLVTTFSEEPKSLYTNLGNLAFEDRGRASGLVPALWPWVSWGARFLDVENDGWLDLLVANGEVHDQAHRFKPNTRYPQPVSLLRSKTGRFTDAAAEGGSDLQTPIVGRALCGGDIDNDGRPDAVVTNLDGQPLLLRNVAPSPGSWLRVGLRAPGPNRYGIGARVTVTTEDGPQSREVSTSGGYLSAHDPRQHFGLGRARSVRDILVRWPDGVSESFGPHQTDREVALRRGSGRLQPTVPPG